MSAIRWRQRNAWSCNLGTVQKAKWKPFHCSPRHTLLAWSARTRASRNCFWSRWRFRQGCVRHNLCWFGSRSFLPIFTYRCCPSLHLSLAEDGSASVAGCTWQYTQASPNLQPFGRFTYLHRLARHHTPWLAFRRNSSGINSVTLFLGTTSILKHLQKGCALSRSVMRGSSPAKGWFL